MITTADLKSQTRRELADLARNYGVPGWHGLKKDELVTEIRKVQTKLRRKEKSEPKPSKTSHLKASGSGTSRTAASKSASSTRHRKSNNAIVELPAPKVDPKTARIRSQLRRRSETMAKHRDLTTKTRTHSAKQGEGDRVVLMVRDSYWIQANWEITAASVQRAKVSMGQRWLIATPTLRVLAIGDADNNATESVLRDITIHGGVDNWYIDVDNPTSSFRVAIGYCVGDDFHAICRSNVVETPRVGQCDRIDDHWSDIAEDYERIYSLSGGYDANDGDLREMFEQRMHRSMPLRNGDGGTINKPSLLKQTKLPFAVDAEVIIFGKSAPGASVSIAGSPVKTLQDGSFTVRMELPDRRQVLPVTAESQDGLQQRTTVIAIERNTKHLEAVSRDELFQ